MKFSNVLVFVAVSASTSSGILAARLGQRIAVDYSLEKRQGKAGVGESCTKDADCQTGACATQHGLCVVLNVPNGQQCLENRQCQSGYCPDGSDGNPQFICLDASLKGKFPDNHTCQKDDDCQSGYCPTSVNQCHPANTRPPLGGTCTADNDCKTGGVAQACISSTCAAVNLGDGSQCVADKQCASGTCSTSAHTCSPKATGGNGGGTGGGNGGGNGGGGNTNNGGGNTNNGGNTTPVNTAPSTFITTAAGGSTVTVVTTPTVQTVVAGPTGAAMLNKDMSKSGWVGFVGVAFGLFAGVF